MISPDEYPQVIAYTCVIYGGNYISVVSFYVPFSEVLERIKEFANVKVAATLVIVSSVRFDQASAEELIDNHMISITIGD